ncbi:MAG: bifunctional precorrin-2 dehydrogenase/sirohydrochlorin ferrochelatase [Acidobacteria bacterium]|nr:bifunctional precorrin-2 dehydrogenase/sirohydrochlorin ferrochelatase [Acidobacteriota bacterium]
MRYYPIFLNLGGRRAVVVGGGKVAERKVRKLLRAGARVHVISPELTPGLKKPLRQRKISVTPRRYRAGDIRSMARKHSAILVFAATSDPVAQRAVQRDAAAIGALVNVADDPARCDFIVPASIMRGNMHVAISTSGTDPALAKWLRKSLGAEFRKIKRQRAKGKSQK